MHKSYKIKQNRRFLLIYLFLAVAAVFIVSRLFLLQIKGGAQYQEIADSRLALSVSLDAPRGEITDRYGRVLATNKTGYFIMLEKTGQTKEELQKELLSALSILIDTDEEVYQDALPLTFRDPISFSKTEKEIRTFLVKNNFSGKETAREVLSSLCEKYQIDAAISLMGKRLLCGVYFGMEQEGFSHTTPYTLAENVSIETVIRLKENGERFPSVRIYEKVVREYPYPETAAHILGRVGKISSEEYSLYQDKGYKKTDSIGKQGIEKAFESSLKGKDGIRSIEENLGLEPLGIVESKEPVIGDSVILTIDLELQQAAEKALKKAVESVNHSGKYGGAVVAVDTNSGEILACASFPTYDIGTFNKNYEKLVKNRAKPMFNRALAGLYAPGSTFKPISAIAAIESGVVTGTEKIATKGKYEYLDRTFSCNIFRATGKTHGTIDLQEALSVSCNYYFYEIGKQTGIDAIASTAERFGLADLTGIELVGEEAKGKIATPSLREKNGGTWYPGDVLQAAIGQSDNLFTPISLANYAATIANGGTNYKTHIVKSIKSGTSGQILKTYAPQVQRMAGVSKETLNTVKAGMEKVTQTGGTAANAFSGFMVPVAGKTGSAQVKGSTNGLFIGYAPQENPQIAICVVVENGGAGSLAASVSREVFSAYFEKQESIKNQEEKPYSLIP